ncbi:NAD(P)-binding Rossmann-fold superfamily protein [Actinidia rufa]|uniref:NAD(P)-binding Rossmann-fold superfamily protein n=1 Tax=Actinidia rufa TaxID=165716 RepID=A0A7J0E509_9ERIC|nr:NAD(P)-binding Rossmann-fold superfamily protein [Actinidia rufa]
MAAHGVKTLIYSSTCATYGEPEKMPITEVTPQLPINPYGKAKKMAEDIILDFHKNSDMAIMILRYFNVIGSDPDGRLGEAPRPELREHGRISGACFDAARGIVPGLKVSHCLRWSLQFGFIMVCWSLLLEEQIIKLQMALAYAITLMLPIWIDAHVKALEKAKPGKVGIYNVGTGRGRSVKEFVEACKKATGVNIKVDFLPRRPGDYAEVFSDPTKIRLELNWTARYTDLQYSLQIAWRWQKAHCPPEQHLQLGNVVKRKAKGTMIVGPSFKDALISVRATVEGVEVVAPEPCSDDEEDSKVEYLVIILSKEDKERIRKPWAQSLIIKFVGRNFVFSFLVSKLQSLWKPTQKIFGMELGNHYLLVPFQLEVDIAKLKSNG